MEVVFFFILNGLPITLESIGKLLISIALPIGLGMTIGSSVIYILCYYIGKPFVTRWGKYLGLNWEDINKFNKKISNEKRDYLTIYIARAIPVIPSVDISGFCGVVRYNWKKYLSLTFLGGITRASILGFIGWQFGNYYTKIGVKMSILEEYLLILFIIVIVVYIINKKRKK